MHEGEHGRIGTDAQRQRADHDEREAGTAAHVARGVPDVRHRVGQPPHRPRIAMQFLRAIDAPHRESRGSTRLAWRLSTPTELLLEQGQVRVDFTSEVGFQASGPDAVEQPRQPPADLGHHSASPVSSRFTSAADRCHHSACSARPRVPAFVIA